MKPLRPVIAGVLTRWMRTPFAHRFLRPVIPPLDMWLFRVTGGRFQLSAVLLPSLVLTSVGASTGRRRETPLACWPQPDGSILIAGSNWGLTSHPAWTGNLIKHPAAEIVMRHRTVPVRASLLRGAEREAAWPLLEARLPGYRRYEQLAGREVRIFRLVPSTPESSEPKREQCS